MIIDTHVHIGSIMDFQMSCDDVLYSMERYGIDFSLVSNVEAAELDHLGRPIPVQVSQNDAFRKTLALAQQYPERIGALPWMKLRSEKPDREFIRLLEQNRALVYGIKLHPFHSRVAPDDPSLEAIYEIARAYQLPIVSHTGGCEEARSVHLYRAAKAHPDLSFVMVHMDLGTDHQEAISLLGEAENLYGDTTWVSVSATLSAVKRWGSGKILFGSDSPIDGADTYLHNKTGDRSLYQEYFNEFRAIVSPEDYDNIMYRNAARLFGIRLS
ncbi:amidohydrolase family protein [Ruminococcus sp.]|uniref:amidohydrolase family protein n=1 Tax=Ruminococcus sp. TaxID=41978 RepID=UPI00388DD38D